MSSSLLRPANTAEPMAPGWKREPSSLVQATAISGRRVLRPASSIASSASKADSTPYMPSKRPPVGWLSMCEPLITGSAWGSLPSRRTKRLPMASVKIEKPRALAHDAEKVAGGRILGRQRLAVDAALRRAAQLRHVGVPLPQTVLAHRARDAHVSSPILSREL